MFPEAFYFPLFGPLAREDIRVACPLGLVIAWSLGGSAAEGILIRRAFLPPGGFGGLLLGLVGLRLWVPALETLCSLDFSSLGVGVGRGMELV